MAWNDAGGAPGGWWGAGAGALGVGADIYAFMQNLAVRRQAEKIADILGNPAKLTAYINQAYQPMGEAQAKAVHRDLGANWATMTGGAPGGAMNQYVADALAKIESQRYSDAAGRSLQALTGSMPRGPAMPMGNTAQIMQALAVLKRMGGGSGAAPTRTPGIANFGDYGKRFDSWFGSADRAIPDATLPTETAFGTLGG